MKSRTELMFLTVLYGLRLAGRIESLDQESAHLLMEKCKQNGLFFKITYLTSDDKNLITIIFSKNESIVHTLYKHQLSPDKFDQTIQGKLYGYPNCCIEMSKKTQVLTKNNFNDELETLISLSSHSTYPFYLRYSYDFGFYFHVPCSLDCQYTKSIALSYLKLFYDINKSTKKIQDYISGSRGEVNVGEKIFFFL